MYGLPKQYSAVIRAIKEGYTFLQDVAAVEYEESRYNQTRYMANVAGVGFDAAVIKRGMTMRERGAKGARLYIRALISTFFRYKPTGVKIWIDDRLMYNNLLFSLAIGVGKYNGGGIQQLPIAVADDGLLDITLIRPIHWWHILFRLRRFFNGEIYSIGHVQHLQGSKIRIESSPEIQLEIDGELLGGTPVELRVLHRAVKVIVNKSFIDNISNKK
jgi:diacylglycerol kinase family enzyme